MRRRLTVSGLRRDNRAVYAQNAYVPYIRLNGRWLEQAGFEIGQTVRLVVEERAILIQPEVRS